MSANALDLQRQATEALASSAASASGVPTSNKAPIVADEWITAKAGQALSAHQSVLLLNDSDTDGGVLTVGELSDPLHGSLTRAADGTLIYIADADYSGPDSFTYTVSDGQGGFTTGTVHINVEPCTTPNLPPVTQDEWVTVRAGVAANTQESTLLLNDQDPEGGALTIRNLGKPAHGTLTRADDGTLTYVANPDYSGNDSFTYEVVDPQGNVSVATVHICVLPRELTVQITAVVDDVGSQTGPVALGGLTDDRRPTIQGRTEANATVAIFDGANKLGEVTADANGNFSFTPNVDLAHGPHDFKAYATAVDGKTAYSNHWDIQVDCPTVPPLPAPIVVIGEDLNNDGVISKAENTGRADAIVTLSVGAKAGDTLFVTDQSGAQQQKLLTAADIAAGKVTFTDGFAMPAEGQTLTLTAQIRTSEGVLSLKSSDSALLDTTAPGNPVITIVTDTDNNGRINQTELNAAGGIDLKVDLPASAKAGDKLTVIDQAGNKIEVTLSAAQIAAKAVNFDNAFPTPANGATITVTATLTDPVGNVSLPSSDSAVIDRAPSAVLSVSAPTVTEGQPLVFTISTSSSQIDTAMTLNLASGTAIVGTDTASKLQANFGKGWVDVVGNQVLVPAGTTSYQVQVATVDDKVIENRETVSLTVSTSTVASKQGIGTIIDNDICEGMAFGKEDTPLTLTWANFNTDALPGAQAKVQVTSLPTDGKLEFNVSGRWTAVATGQVLTKADIDAGKLRFTPDANESGGDAYKVAGVGNKFNDYAQLTFNAFQPDGQALAGNKVHIDIAPDAELGTLRGFVSSFSYYGSAPSLGGGRWDRYNLSSTGASPDVDGSERTRMLVVGWQGAKVAVIGANGVAEFVQADAAGNFYVPVNASVLVEAKAPSGGGCQAPSSKLLYYIVREEVNAAGEVLDLERGPAYLQNGPLINSPIVLDLDGNGVQTVDVTHGVLFDLNADGQKDHVGWTDGKDGLLVMDRNGDGQISSGAELFGEFTESQQGGNAENGFAALREIDSNSNGLFDSGDAQWANVQVWVDENQDGLSQVGELKSLDAWGVASISLDALVGTDAQNGNLMGLTSHMTRTDGTQAEVVDVWFAVASPDSSAELIDAKDVLSCESMTELCLGTAPTQALATAPEADVQLSAHAASLHHRAAFERWEDATHAML